MSLQFLLTLLTLFAIEKAVAFTPVIGIALTDIVHITSCVIYNRNNHNYNIG